MISPELRVTIVERNRLSVLLRRCDVEMNRAIDSGDAAGWRHWLSIRADAWEAVDALDQQVKILGRYAPAQSRSTVRPVAPSGTPHPIG